MGCHRWKFCQASRFWCAHTGKQKKSNLRIEKSSKRLDLGELVKDESRKKIGKSENRYKRYLQKTKHTRCS